MLQWKALQTYRGGSGNGKLSIADLQRRIWQWKATADPTEVCCCFKAMESNSRPTEEDQGNGKQQHPTEEDQGNGKQQQTYRGGSRQWKATADLQRRIKAMESNSRPTEEDQGNGKQQQTYRGGSGNGKQQQTYRGGSRQWKATSDLQRRIKAMESNRSYRGGLAMESNSRPTLEDQGNGKQQQTYRGLLLQWKATGPTEEDLAMESNSRPTEEDLAMESNSRPTEEDQGNGKQQQTSSV